LSKWRAASGIRLERCTMPFNIGYILHNETVRFWVVRLTCLFPLVVLIELVAARAFSKWLLAVNPIIFFHHFAR
jgi:hypothetical protein